MGWKGQPHLPWLFFLKAPLRKAETGMREACASSWLMGRPHRPPALQITRRHPRNESPYSQWLGPMSSTHTQWAFC